MTDDSKASSWKDPAIWGRVAFALLFLLILGLVVGPLAFILSIVQAVFTIATGEDNRNLRDLGASLTEYIGEILLFTTWNREQKPFPFAEFPRAERTDDAPGEDSAAGAAGAATGVGAATEEADVAEPAAETVKAEDSGGDVDEEAGSDSAPADKPGKKNASKAGKKTSSSKPASDDAPAKD